MTEFLATLTKAGYTERSRHRKKGLIAPFTRWIRWLGIAVAQIDEASIEAFLATAPRCHRERRTSLGQFLAYLRTVGAVPLSCC